jgi:hypothetical protein
MASWAAGGISGIELEIEVRLERGPILHRRSRGVEHGVIQRGSSVELSSASGNTFDANAWPDGLQHSSGCELFGLASVLLVYDKCRSFQRRLCDNGKQIRNISFCAAQDGVQREHDSLPR